MLPQLKLEALLFVADMFRVVDPTLQWGRMDGPLTCIRCIVCLDEKLGSTGWPSSGGACRPGVRTVARAMLPVL